MSEKVNNKQTELCLYEKWGRDTNKYYTFYMVVVNFDI